MSIIHVYNLQINVHIRVYLKPPGDLRHTGWPPLCTPLAAKTPSPLWSSEHRSFPHDYGLGRVGSEASEGTRKSFPTSQTIKRLNLASLTLHPFFLRAV